MAGVIIGSISLALTLLVYAYGARQRLRKPRFWVTFAEVRLDSLPSAAAVGDSRPHPMVVRGGGIAFAFIGGGLPCNVIDAALTYEGQASMSVELEEVMSVAAELSNRATVQVPSGSIINVTDELPCLLELDSGHEIYNLRFTLRLHAPDRYYYTGSEWRLGLLAERLWESRRWWRLWQRRRRETRPRRSASRTL